MGVELGVRGQQGSICVQEQQIILAAMCGRGCQRGGELMREKAHLGGVT